ncbi:MAG: hypothetical protein QOC71_1093, partial [Thermoplasmata archaeon]|nr:hypothetical protein [Thermoplasmata archaeon]
MKPLGLLVALPLLVVALAGCGDDGETDDDATPSQPFTMTSSSFPAGGAIPAKHTCDGDQISPQLTITGAPEGTQSLALTMKDPDVPTPQAPTRTLNHWVVYNITVGGAVFPEGDVPVGAQQGANDFGPGYLGPCPP